MIPEEPLRPDSVSLELTRLLQQEDPDGSRFGRVLRESFDQAYDGVHTGRFRPEELSKTESAHIGSIVEINIRREFDGFITDGISMDFQINGYDVDCKYSKQPFGWMIPNETVGHYALVVHADDRKGLWRAGFVRISEEILTQGGNRDQKRTIKAAGREAISWAWMDAPLPPNVLLQLPPEVSAALMTNRSGQQRINNLFRSALGMRIPRGTVATVAMQKDYMKRVRGNGGARSTLQPEGIVILGDYLYHRQIAKQLGLPVPKAGDSVAVRLVPWDDNPDRHKVQIGDEYWTVAQDQDPVVPAPKIPFFPTLSTVENAVRDGVQGGQSAASPE